MYRVAIIVNENETLHSVYADTKCILKKALDKVYPNNVDDIYSFELIDKFNIYTLFEKGVNNLFTFDSIFIATNACNNKEIYDELSTHAEILAQYIDDGNGNCHGICIVNQQKLGATREEARCINFLPPIFSYKLIKRIEKKSSEGKVTIHNQSDLLVNFPVKINNSTIELCCSGEHNQFMPHKYRYIVVPNYDSSYEVVYEDDSYDETGVQKTRALLLKSRIANERIVISSMVLDWAEHLDQLANIIVFVTEGVNQFAFINKTTNINKRFERYIKKARDYKMALKEYTERDVEDVLSGITPISLYKIDVENKDTNQAEKSNRLYPHRVFVFSNNWSKEEVDFLWKKYVAKNEKDIVFYRLVNENTNTKNELTLVSSFSKSIKNSRMFLCAEEWLMANFITFKWRKSIWTYEYILNLNEHISFTSTGFIVPVYKEIIDHYKINNIDENEKTNMDYSKVTNPKVFKDIHFQSYDNVFNSTCSCCNVISKLYSLCKNNEIYTLDIDNTKFDTYRLLEERNHLGNWIVYKLNNLDYCKRISWQDRLMAFVALYESNYITDLKTDNSALYFLLIEELEKNNLFLEKLFTSIDRVTYDVNPNITVSDLCKLLKYIYVADNIMPGKLNSVALICAIEKKLLNDQNYNGSWKNLSETAEVAVALLYGRKFSSLSNINPTFETIINRAVNYIQNNFNYSKSCWLDDENTTAKSLTAILLYDEIFNFSFDDFLVDLINTTSKNNPVYNINNNIKALDFAQEEYNKLLDEKLLLDKSLVELKKNNLYSKKMIKKYKFLIGTISVTAALAILFIICLIGIFVTSYPDEWWLIVDENLAVILSTALGLVVTTILTGVAQHTKSKLIEEYEDRQINI